MPALPVRAREPCRRTVLRHLGRERGFPAVRTGAVVEPEALSLFRPIEIILTRAAGVAWPCW
ncbi:hypothetical protein [Streptomyces sp. NPDC004270]